MPVAQLFSLGVIARIDFMFGGQRRKPIDRWTDGELRSYLAFITVICVAMLAMSLFTNQSVWFLWIFRGFILVGLSQSWYMVLREFRRRRCRR